MASRLGGYEILAPIGRGGAGTVFRARSGERDVAIKLLHGVKPEALARFERERRLQTALGENEGFVPLLDSGDSPEGPYIVMPLLTGGTLRDRIARGPFREEEAITLGRTLAETLGRAHAQGIVHRDMKPENILFTSDGRPLVADLGLAKHYSQDALGASQSVGLSKTGEFRGTAGYMAPEQAQDAREVGPEADVFSVGAIVYECLTGVPAFEGESIFEVVGKVERSDYRSLRSVRPRTPRWLAALVARSLALDPGRRFANGAALAQAFTARLDPSRRRRALGVGLVLGLAALAAGGKLLVSTLAERARSERAALVAGAIASGRAHEIKGDLAQALKDYTRAVELAPGSSEPLEQRARARAKLGDPAGVIEDCTKAIALDPLSSAAYGNRGWAREQKGDFEGAIADDTRAIELDPRLAIAWCNRATAKSDKGDSQGALDDFTKAIELSPRLKEAWCSRGDVKVDLGDLDGALADFTKAIDVEPRFAGAFCNRGGVRVKRKELALALEDFTRAIVLDPRLAVAWRSRGEAKRSSRDFEGALEDFARAIALEPGADVNYYDRAITLELAGDTQGALADHKRVIALRPLGARADASRLAVARLEAP